MTKQRIEAVEPWENQSVQAQPEPAWDASMRLAKPRAKVSTPDTQSNKWRNPIPDRVAPAITEIRQFFV